MKTKIMANVKTKFLEQAIAKFKEAIKNGRVKEMNFIYSPSLILRLWFDQTIVEPNQKNSDKETGFCHTWANVDTLPIQKEMAMNRLPQKNISEVISNTSEGDDDAILSFLCNAKEETLNEMANGYEFEHKGEIIEIIMWQPVEHWTLRQLAQHVGIMM